MISMHWADVIAKDVVDNCDHPLIATGISPTGILHVGSLREAITGESIRSAVEATGADVKLIYIIDDFDPLRKRYPFLPEEYEKYVGMPICRIPCPCGKHNNYAHHFVQPFLDTIETLGMHCEVIWTHELYEKGKFAPWIDKAITKREEVIQILHDVTGKDMDPNYAPYNPVCSKCGRFCHPKFDTYSYPHLEYECSCGNKGRVNIEKEEGKLTWRLEWPAKWMIFGTSAEPFGKDHAAAGGSYDSGKVIIDKIFGGKAPFPIPYEFVQLKGVGQMHKSLGSPVTGLDAIQMMPPEVLNYLFLRVNPSKSIDFDSGIGVLDMCDEYDRMERLYFEGEWSESEDNAVAAYKIAQHNHIPKKLPLQVSCRHLVNVVQMASDFDEVVTILKRTMDLSEATMEDMDRLRKRVECVKYWLNGFAPDIVKFSIRQTIPTSIDLSVNEKIFFQELVNRLNDTEWNVENINKVFNDVAKSLPIGTKGGYKAMYKILIAKEAGPRLALFLASMDKKFVINRLVQAAAQ